MARHGAWVWFLGVLLLGCGDRGQPLPEHLPDDVRRVDVHLRVDSYPEGAEVTCMGETLGTTPLDGVVSACVAQHQALLRLVWGEKRSRLYRVPVVDGAAHLSVTRALEGPKADLPDFTRPSGTPDEVHSVTLRRRFDDRHPRVARFTLTSPCAYRWARVEVQGEHEYNADVIIALTTPDGRRHTLERHRTRGPFRPLWFFGGDNSAGAGDTSSKGTWLVHIEDAAPEDRGRVHSVSLGVYCE